MVKYSAVLTTVMSKIKPFTILLNKKENEVGAGPCACEYFKTLLMLYLFFHIQIM